MGNCPSGFQPGSRLFSCRKECPADFTYTQGSGQDRCTHKRYPARYVVLTLLNGLPQSTTPPPATYEDETTRFDSALAGLRVQIQQDEADEAALTQAQTAKSAWVGQYANLEGSYNALTEESLVHTKLRETKEAIRSLRPPTAPATDLDKERRELSLELQQNMLLVQVSLFLLVLSLLSYMVLPADMAHGITFVLLCVGIATGFFLRR